jgi:hypothetical protein
MLTQAQERFADEHGATSCANSHGFVCVYAERPERTIRWIIDSRGRLLERTQFDRV